jgi:NAD(P)-dependent dehydrogenase (short-subunit alcohol dehydrogenase family)
MSWILSATFLRCDGYDSTKHDNLPISHTRCPAASAASRSLTIHAKSPAGSRSIVFSCIQKFCYITLTSRLISKEYTVSPEGWESTLQVNVLSTALLVLLLLPKLRASKTSADIISHLVIVTSEAHRWLEATDIPDPGQYGGNILQAANARPADAKTWDGLLQNAKSKLFAMYCTS